MPPPPPQAPGPGESTEPKSPQDFERRFLAAQERNRQSGERIIEYSHQIAALKAALTAANLPIPPYPSSAAHPNPAPESEPAPVHTVHEPFPKDPSPQSSKSPNYPETPESGTALKAVAESSPPHSESALPAVPPTHEDTASPESAPSATECVPAPAAPKFLPSAEAVLLSEGIGPIGPIGPIRQPPSAEPPPTQPSDQFLAREQAKLQAALAKLTAEHHRLLKAGWRPTHKLVLENRARYFQLQSLAIPIGTGLTFAQALAQSTPITLRPP